jgi:hypothetical protein
MHRIILGLKDEDPRLGDHIDGDGLNNIRSNLRVASSSGNAQNRRLSCCSSSGFKGVTWRKRERVWYAQIGYKDTRKHLGVFSTAEEAARAYDKAALQLFGEFANLNFPG